MLKVLKNRRRRRLGKIRTLRHRFQTILRASHILPDSQTCVLRNAPISFDSTNRGRLALQIVDTLDIDWAKILHQMSNTLMVRRLVDAGL